MIILEQYKDKNGKFVAVANPTEAYWQTIDGQKYLKEYYELEEAYKKGLVTGDELRFLQDDLVHPGKPCSYSEEFHFVEKPHMTEEEIEAECRSVCYGDMI